MNESPASPDALLKNAITSIRDLKQQLNDVNARAREPIAVLGMACRFPGGGADPVAYFDALLEGVDAVREVPPSRWRDVPEATRAALLEDVEGFDAAFFEMSEHEAQRTDPQHRMALEVAYHAFEHAGLTRAALAGSATGVFLAICNSDHWHHEVTDVAGLGAHSVAGCLPSMAANRISYTFDLRGPSLTVDTACSSSLVALDLAVQHLRAGRCDLALVGGVNLLLAPGPQVAYDRFGAASPTARCHAFDAAADGFVRGEGCAFIVLARRTDALMREGTVHAWIRGTAVNQDGRSAGPTAPNPAAQAAVLRAALENAGVSAHEVTHVEAHGTGTPLGDPIEAEALVEVYGGREASAPPCVLGAAKTNIGHLEAAAGMAGVIKVIMSMQRAEIPALRGFSTPNPHLALDGTGLVLAKERTAWSGAGRTRLAGVSSFGIGGTNAHVILEEAPHEAGLPAHPRGHAFERKRFPAITAGHVGASVPSEGIAASEHDRVARAWLPRLRARLAEVLASNDRDPDAASEARLSADADLRETLDLDSLVLVDWKDLVDADAPFAAIPLRLLLSGANLATVAERIAEAARASSAHVHAPKKDEGLSADVLSMLASFAAMPLCPEPFDKGLVHKSHRENVLLTRLLALGGKTDPIACEIAHRLEHPFFYEHPKDHVPSIYLVEAAKQFITAASHVVLDVPLGRPFAVDGMEMKFRRYAETCRPMYVVGRFSEPMRAANGEIEHVVHTLSFVQDGRVIGTGQCSLHGFDAEEYRAARGDVARVDDWSRDARSEA